VSVTRIVGHGVNGDPLHEGKLDLPELLDDPTDEDSSWARSFIMGRRWREAVSYRASASHEYTVPDWRPDETDVRDFDEFVGFIRRFGYADYYYRIRHLYWAVDEHKYWTMGLPAAETTVISRARLDAPEPWKSAMRPPASTAPEPDLLSDVPVAPRARTAASGSRSAWAGPSATARPRAPPARRTAQPRRLLHGHRSRGSGRTAASGALWGPAALPPWLPAARSGGDAGSAEASRRTTE
jgi:hypothetical protein